MYWDLEYIQVDGYLLQRHDTNQLTKWRHVSMWQIQQTEQFMRLEK